MSITAWWCVLCSLLLWSTSSLFASLVSRVPSLLAVSIFLLTVGVVSLPWWRSCRLPWSTWAVGVGGIFGYNAMFLSAFHGAPAVEVNLVNYLWPLLTVLLAPLILRGWQLHWFHIVGATVGFAGAALVITNGNAALDWTHAKGYLLALGGAAVWACYSLATKRVPLFPSVAVGGFCMVAGILSLLLFLVFQGADLGQSLPRGREITNNEDSRIQRASR